MKKSYFLLFVVFLLSLAINAQKLTLENIYEFEDMKKNSYLGNVEFNPEDNLTKLSYVRKDPLQTVFTTYTFNEKLEFVDKKESSFTLGDAIDATVKKTISDIQNVFSWFDYQGESYTRDAIWIFPSWKGEITARKIQFKYTYSWTLGEYTRTFKFMDKVQISGLEGGRLYLYNRINNSETGEVLILVGLKAEKGDKENKWQEARKFQIIKIKTDLSAELLETIEFPYNMAISFTKVLSNEEAIETSAEGASLGDMLEMSSGDLANGNAALIFSPLKSMIGKKQVNPNPADQTLVVIDADGKIVSKVNYEAPTSGWVIEDFILSDNDNEVYFYGPAKDDAYVSSLMPVNSPLAGKDDISDIKWKNFQLMKIKDGELAWIKNTDLKEFKAKAVNPPSQRKSPDYVGKNFEKYLAYATPEGEVIISGQKYTTTQVPDPDSDVAGATKKVIDAYKDLVLFHFNTEGELKAQYGVKRDKNNKYSKANLTPQYIYLNKDNSQLYWIYGEIKGLRKGFEIKTDIAGFGGSVGLSKSKLLFYPTVAKIDLKSASVSDFTPLGGDADGKQLYYTNPEFPQLLSPDASNLTFIGENKNGKIVWLGRMELD